MQKKILFIGHDANYAGAQYLLLHLLTYLKGVESVKTMLLLGNGGGLIEEYSKVAEVVFWQNGDSTEKENSYFQKIAKVSRLEPFLTNNKNGKTDTLKTIEAFNPEIVFSNTIANGKMLQELANLNYPFVIYCHELEKSIQLYSTPELIDFQLNNAKAIFAGSSAVKENLIENHNINSEKVTIFYSQINCENIENSLNKVDKKAVKKQLGIPNEAIIIGGCANAEWRKGLDLFILTALQVLKNTSKNTHFIWIGISEKHSDFKNINYDLEKMGIKSNVHLLESTAEYLQYLACFDVFFLSSREDPYPLVMLEAGINKNPIVSFEKSGGSVEFIDSSLGLHIPYLDITQAANLMIKLVEDDDLRSELGEKIYLKAKQHDVPLISEKILEAL
jgi:glycosyltransferase involved in cell wall biosynthesis